MGNLGHRIRHLRLLQSSLNIRSIVAVHYRGYGQSRGWSTERGLKRDADAALAFARQEYAGSPIMCFGHSLGWRGFSLSSCVYGYIFDHSYTMTNTQAALSPLTSPHVTQTISAAV